jgi:2-polyprenyl-3-methyl-5-hydroxy-6-metoxy-1,4-benzoquinol methylase
VSELEPTGERLVPQRQHGELVHAEHLARYRFAAQLAPGRRVLDAACGEGYGTAMLATGGATAVGVDVDEPTIAHARERYAAEFRVADVADLPFEDASFDLVVCFETIEHVEDAERVLGELARVLDPDGLLLISTPNTHEYLVDNEFHTREFTHEEFVALLAGRFPRVRLLYQHNWTSSAVLEEPALREAGGDRPLELELTKTVGAAPGGELYTLALCGRGVDAPLRQVGVMAGTDEAHRLATRLVSAEETAQLWHDRFKDIESKMSWMTGTLSWRLTKPFRAPARLWERLRGRR